MPSPTVETTSQQVITTAIVDVDSQYESENGAVIQQCANEAASSVGIELLAIVGGASSELFWQAFRQYLMRVTPGVDIGTAFLRSETLCRW